MKNLFTSICLLTIAMFLLSACATSGSSEEGDSTGSDGDTDKNEVTVAFQENIQTMDPHNGSSGIDISVQYAIYESMFTPDKDGELQPLLATDYDISDDGLTYTFKLRDDVTFTDGAEFNAEAVKANLDRIIDSEGSLNNYKSLRNVEEVEVADDYEVEVTLNNINSQFIDKIGMIRMVSPDALEKDIDFGEESAGTGPFVLEKWSHGDYLEAIKNEDYWEEGLPKIDKVTFEPIPEDGSRIAMLKTGETDYIFPVPVNDVESLDAEDNIEVSTVESTYVNYATINTSKEPFNKKEVRQAMNYALNQEDFVKVVKNGYGVASDSVLPATNVFYEGQEPYDYDLDKAKELLAEAGYEDGFTTEIWGSDSSKDKRGMQFIQQQLGKIGIDVEIKQMERGTLSDEINKPESAEDSEVEMWYVGWSSQVGDADNATNPLFSSSSFPPNGSNTAYYDNEKADKLIDEGLHAKDEDEAAEKYAELQEVLWDDAPWLFTAVDEEPTAMKEGLKGIWRSADGNFYLRDIEWE
ncbi:glutathione ABC transporter substrate-binding protein [Oceanobacillus timonensis]|uniref:glutathione ABC transporter substrate-binding protein n=1 Tax=Oceanobacillus timonensis TaxID=1926285 RepID=UPI0009BB70CF|nr:glutathione ABC transporter substrate-binding protein [Oceanobacillus timonensis]